MTKTIRHIVVLVVAATYFVVATAAGAAHAGDLHGAKLHEVNKMSRTPHPAVAVMPHVSKMPFTKLASLTPGVTVHGSVPADALVLVGLLTGEPSFFVTAGTHSPVSSRAPPRI